MRHRIEANGVAYISLDLLCYSDYSNGGSFCRANVRDVLSEYPNAPSVNYGDINYRCDPEKCTFKPYGGVPDFWGKAVAIVAYGGYDTTQVLLLEGHEFTESIESAFADYPVLNEQTVSEVELEMESEAWECWIANDLKYAMAELCEDKSEADFISYDLENDALRDAYYAAKEQCNEYGYVDGDSWFVNVSKLASAALDHVRAALDHVRKHKTEA